MTKRSFSRVSSPVALLLALAAAAGPLTATVHTCGAHVAHGAGAASDESQHQHHATQHHTTGNPSSPDRDAPDCGLHICCFVSSVAPPEPDLWPQYLSVLSREPRTLERDAPRSLPRLLPFALAPPHLG